MVIWLVVVAIFRLEALTIPFGWCVWRGKSMTMTNVSTIVTFSRKTFRELHRSES